MKSGLRDRNNAKQFVAGWGDPTVSMKSGLRDRNNITEVKAGRAISAKSQ